MNGKSFSWFEVAKVNRWLRNGGHDMTTNFYWKEDGILTKPRKCRKAKQCPSNCSGIIWNLTESEKREYGVPGICDCIVNISDLKLIGNEIQIFVGCS